MGSIRVVAQWDNEAGVWVAESDDVPGLVAEAGTVEALAEKLRVLIPELLHANGSALPPDNGGIPFDLLAQRHDVARMVG